MTDFMDLTAGERSPDLFRKWTGITLVAGALERRVWVKAGAKITFPNLYTLLVGPPGTGKYIIEYAREIWAQVQEPGQRLPAFRVAPDSMTKASLMDTIAKARQSKLLASGPPMVYHTLLIAAEEFGVLLPDYDQSYIHSLNSIFNNKELHEESRRTGSVKELKIVRPQITILGGVQPSYLASTFPEEAWNTGFARRIIMVYCPEPPVQDLFFEPELRPDARQRFLSRLGELSTMYGQLRWTQDAAEHISQWDAAGGPPQPTHSKLSHYIRSRTMMVLKLACVSTVSRTGQLILELADVKRAIAWLLEAERGMPDVFREMIGKSDSQVIEELHYFLTNAWNKNRQQPVNGRAMWSFLMARVPSEKVEKIINTAERANIIARVAGTQDSWVPRPKNEHGVE